MGKIKKSFRESAFVLAVIIGIGVLGGGIAYAYTHTSNALGG